MNIKLPDFSKFSWSEMFNDQYGKTQAVLFCGVNGCLVSFLGFLMSIVIPIISKFLDITVDASFSMFLTSTQNNCLMLFTGSFAGLTAHVFSKDKPLNAIGSKPTETITEMKSNGVEIKETVKEFKTLDPTKDETQS